MQHKKRPIFLGNIKTFEAENGIDMAKGKKTGGKTSSYDPDKAKYICEQLSEGVPLREICRQEGMPAWRTVYDWMYQDADLSAAIEISRDLGWDAIAEDCFRIADTPMYG